MDYLYNAMNIKYLDANTYLRNTSKQHVYCEVLWPNKITTELYAIQNILVTRHHLRPPKIYFPLLVCQPWHLFLVLSSGGWAINPN